MSTGSGSCLEGRTLSVWVGTKRTTRRNTRNLSCQTLFSSIYLSLLDIFLSHLCRVISIYTHYGTSSFLTKGFVQVHTCTGNIVRWNTKRQKRKTNWKTFALNTLMSQIILRWKHGWQIILRSKHWFTSSSNIKIQ